MSRSTQYIGLNRKAVEYLQQVNALCASAHRTKTFGMFGEDVPLGAWTLRDGTVVREVEQVVPWSSGPMIFTCLEAECGDRMFEWVEDSKIRSEFDYDTGRYWV